MTAREPSNKIYPPMMITAINYDEIPQEIQEVNVSGVDTPDVTTEIDLKLGTVGKSTLVGYQE